MIDLPTETFVEVDAPTKLPGRGSVALTKLTMLGLSQPPIRSRHQNDNWRQRNSGRRIIQKWPIAIVTKTKTDDGGELIVISIETDPKTSHSSELGLEREILEVDKWGVYLTKNG